MLGLGQGLLREVKRIENKQLTFPIENASEGRPPLAPAIHVIHVGDVQVAGRHEVADIAVGHQQLLGAVEPFPVTF